MSRVRSIIILSFILAFTASLPVVGQEVHEAPGLSKKQYKAIRKKVRKTTFEEQLKLFDLSAQQGITIANLDSVNEIGQYPLPSPKALSQTTIDYPEYLADLLNVHFYMIPEEAGRFYGLDRRNRKMMVTTYAADSLFYNAVLNHDYIWLGATRNSAFPLEKKKRRAFKKKLAAKLVAYYAQPPAWPKIKPATKETINKYRDWAIQVYGANEAIHSLRRPPYDLLVDKVEPTDENWLSELITEEAFKGYFNKEGKRILLADGTAQLFNIDTASWPAIDSLIFRSIRERVMPGCQLLVAKEGYVIFDKVYGYHTYDSLQKVSHRTLYDLASLTKVLATTQALMLLYDQGKFDPEARLSEVLPYLQETNKAEITGSAVLSHQADLYLYYPFWKKAMEEFKLEKMNGSLRAGSSLKVEPWVADSIVQWAAESELLSERVDSISGTQYFYSDVGFFFLKDLIEKEAGQPLDAYLREHLYTPNKIKLVFNPLKTYPDSLIAPTEFDETLRNELLRGYVHDRNAALLGGVAGQAGLFGNARNIASLMQIHLDHGQYNDNNVFSSGTVKEFSNRHFDGNRRGWGWDMPDLPEGRPGTETDGPVSRYVSDGTFGHTGFTGGMVWADPEEKLIFVFLSNRVHPSAENNKLIEMNIRTRLQDLVYRSLGYE